LAVSHYNLNGKQESQVFLERPLTRMNSLEVPTKGKKNVVHCSASLLPRELNYEDVNRDTHQQSRRCSFAEFTQGEVPEKTLCIRASTDVEDIVNSSDDLNASATTTPNFGGNDLPSDYHFTFTGVHQSSDVMAMSGRTALLFDSDSDGDIPRNAIYVSDSESDIIEDDSFSEQTSMHMNNPNGGIQEENFCSSDSSSITPLSSQTSPYNRRFCQLRSSIEIHHLKRTPPRPQKETRDFLGATMTKRIVKELSRGENNELQFLGENQHAWLDAEEFMIFFRFPLEMLHHHLESLGHE